MTAVIESLIWFGTSTVAADRTPGGEPLCSLAALWVGKQAAPGNVSRCGSSMGRLYPPHGIEAMGKTLRWVVPGSRLLPTHRAAKLQSGSPAMGVVKLPRVCELSFHSKGDEVASRE
jgi:hypothetical protein